MPVSIKFSATVAQVKTLADGGIRVAFDLPESTILEAAQLMECKRAGAVLAVEAATTDSAEPWAGALTDLSQ